MEEIRYKGIDLNKLSIAEIAELLPWQLLNKFHDASVLECSLSLVDKELTLEQKNEIIELAHEMYMKSDSVSLIQYTDAICLWLNEVEKVDTFLKKISDRKYWNLVESKIYY